MPDKPQPQPEAEEFFYRDKDGKRQDAKLHESILAEGDDAAARAVSTKVLRRLGYSDDDIAALHGPTPKQKKQWAQIRTQSLRLLGKAEEREQTEVELWPEEGEKRSEFMDRCTDELEKCIGDRAEEVCDEKWHQSRTLGTKGFVTVRLTGDLAIEPCGKTCIGCKGAAKAGTKRLDSPDLLNPSNGLHKGHGYDHDDRERRRAQEIAERLDPARARDRRGRDGAASEADGGGSDRSLPSGRDVARFDPSEPRDSAGKWTDGGGDTAADDAESSPVEFQELKSADTKRFHDAISAAKAADKFGASVHAYEPDEYRNTRMFVTDGGKIGFALKADGDIVSAFKHPDSKVKQAANAMLSLATKNGGNKLDAFDTVLPRIYSESGFRAVARLAWNDQFAPPGWDKATYAKFNNGEPDVVFMVYDPDHKERYKPGESKRVTTYDEGVAAQDEAIKALGVPMK